MFITECVKLAVVSLYCCLRVWMWLKGSRVFIQENGSAHCRLGNDLPKPKRSTADTTCGESPIGCGRRCTARANDGIGRRARTVPQSRALIGPCRALQRTTLRCVWCVQVVNSSKQLLLIPRSVVGKNYIYAGWNKNKTKKILKLFYTGTSCRAWYSFW